MNNVEIKNNVTIFVKMAINGETDLETAVDTIMLLFKKYPLKKE
jgi:hypothetical protein